MEKWGSGLIKSNNNPTCKHHLKTNGVEENLNVYFNWN